MTLLHVPLLFAKAMALAVTRLDSPALTTALETGSKAFFPLRVKTRAIALAMAIFAAPTDPFVWIDGPDRRVDDLRSAQDLIRFAKTSSASNVWTQIVWTNRSARDSQSGKSTR